MKWSIKGSTYHARRNGKLLGYIQRDRTTKLYKWTCSAFASRSESKNYGSHPTLDGAKLAFEDFWNLSLKYYDLLEDPKVIDNQTTETDEFSDKDIKDLSEIL